MSSQEGLVDSIRLISDGLSAINFRLADLLPTDPEFDELERERDRVQERLNKLVKEFFKSSTKRFIDADSELAEVTRAAAASLQKLEDLQTTLDNVRRFVTAIDTFIGAVLPLA